MRKQLRTRTSSESGFTLVELLVVMLILGLLASIAIPAFFNQRVKAQDAEAKSTLKTAQTALETYATDHGGLLHRRHPGRAQADRADPVQRFDRRECDVGP